MNDGLTDEKRCAIRSVFARFPRVHRVLMFGSRSLGTWRDYSDIDLAIEGRDIDLELLARIQGGLEELSLPYRFDIVNWAAVENPEFRDHIDRCGRMFYETEEQAGT